MSKLTLRDVNQATRYEHDEERDAKRVILVGGELVIPEIKLPDNIQFKTIEVPKIIEQVKIERIEVPIITKEIQKVEVPVIIKEIQTIEIPVIKTETKFERIDIPVIIEKVTYVDKPIIIEKTLEKLTSWVIPVLVSQSLAILTLIVLFLKR